MAAIDDGISERLLLPGLVGGNRVLRRTVTLRAVEPREARSGPLAAVIVRIAITDADGDVGIAERTMLYRGVRA